MKNISLYLILGLLLNLNYLHGQDLVNLKSPKNVTLVSYFSMNEVKLYHVTEKKQEFEDGKEKPKVIENSSYDLRIKVIDSTANSYILTMTYGNFIFENVSDKQGIDKAFYKLNDKLTIKYKLNELGEFDTILNIPELKSFVDSNLEVLKKYFDQKLTSTGDKLNFLDAYQTIKTFLTKDENVYAMFLNDIISIHGMYGFDLTLNELLEIEMEYTLMNKLSLSGKGELVLRNIDKKNKLCTIGVKHKMDTGELKKYILELLPLLIPSEDMKEITPANFQFNNSMKEVYQMNLEDGWMDSIKEDEILEISMGKDRYKMLTNRTYLLR